MTAYDAYDEEAAGPGRGVGGADLACLAWNI